MVYTIVGIRSLLLWIIWHVWIFGDALIAIGGSIEAALISTLFTTLSCHL